MDLRRFALAARTRWWIVVAGIVLGVGAAAGLTATQTAQYRSTVTFYVGTPASPTQSYQAALYGQQLVNSYVKLLGSTELARRVIADAGLHASPTAISAKISGTAELNTVLVTANAVDSTPAGALRLTRSIAAVFGPMVSGLTNDPTANRPTVVLSVVSGPTPPEKTAPKRTLNYGLGFLVGLVLGLGVATLREFLDTSIRSDDQLAAAGLQPLGSLTRVRHRGAAPLIVGPLRRSVLAEEVRQLRTGLQYAHFDRSLEVIAVVSPEPLEGRTVVAINVALAYAEAGHRTLLIDADFRRPRVADYLDLKETTGLAEVLRHKVLLAKAVQRWGDTELDVLTAGTLPSYPGPLLSSPEMVAFVAQAREHYDTVIIDTPALGPVSDGMSTMLQSDGALMVVRHGRTTRDQLQRVLDTLRPIEAPIIGAVRTMARRPRRYAKRVEGRYLRSDEAAVDPYPDSKRQLGLPAKQAKHEASRRSGTTVG
ncbi:MAG: polysaccharide biosynthesis tyrosine autokinase [Jatrophihabitans sp.]|uniref:polysaccharide biosynthesis tyrosine autokinase n=1 Tax=Jatrophihabitans sp. TaxID=1932789 RepID=UPI003F7E6B7A